MTKKSTVDEIVGIVEKYSRAVPVGAAVFAVEIYIANLFKEENESYIAEVTEKRKNLSKELLTMKKEGVVNIVTMQRKMHELTKLNATIVNFKPPIIRVIHSEGQAVEDGAQLIEYADRWEIVLPEAALKRFVASDMSTCPSPCNEKKESLKCGKRDCALKCKLRLDLGHELSHILAETIDSYKIHLRATYPINPETNEPEVGHSEFSEKLRESRNAYLEGK